MNLSRNVSILAISLSLLTACQEDTSNKPDKTKISENTTEAELNLRNAELQSLELSGHYLAVKDNVLLNVSADKEEYSPVVMNYRLSDGRLVAVKSSDNREKLLKDLNEEYAVLIYNSYYCSYEPGCESGTSELKAKMHLINKESGSVWALPEEYILNWSSEVITSVVGGSKKIYFIASAGDKDPDENHFSFEDIYITSPYRDALVSIDVSNPENLSYRVETPGHFKVSSFKLDYERNVIFNAYDTQLESDEDYALKPNGNAPFVEILQDALPVGIDTRVFMEGKSFYFENSDISYIDREKDLATQSIVNKAIFDIGSGRLEIKMEPVMMDFFESDKSYFTQMGYYEDNNDTVFNKDTTISIREGHILKIDEQANTLSIKQIGPTKEIKAAQASAKRSRAIFQTAKEIIDVNIETLEYKRVRSPIGGAIQRIIESAQGFKMEVYDATINAYHKLLYNLDSQQIEVKEEGVRTSFSKSGDLIRIK